MKCKQQVSSFEYETELILFPKIKVTLIQDPYYFLVVKASGESTNFFDFVIMKDLTLNGFGYLSNKNYINPQIDCFNKNLNPIEEMINELDEDKLKKLYHSISDESNNNIDTLLLSRYIHKKEMSIHEMREQTK